MGRSWHSLKIIVQPRSVILNQVIPRGSNEYQLKTALITLGKAIRAVFNIVG